MQNRSAHALFLFTAAFASLANSQSAHAESEDALQYLYGDEEIVSIATGTSKPIYKAPAVATVITAEDIAESGATSLDEVLEGVAGLHVSPSNISRLDSVYSIRGIHTGFNPQVLVLLNGTSFSSLFSGGRPFTFRLPVANISRIEVMRGPGSAVYGADAFSGVINIITKESEEINGTRAGVRAGSFGSRDLWFQKSHDWQRWKMAFSLEWQRTDGDRKRIVPIDALGADPNALTPAPLDTRYDILNTHVTLSDAKWRTELWSWIQNDGGMGPGAAQVIDPTGKQRVNQWLAKVGYHEANWLPNWDLSVNLSHLYQHQDSYFVLFPPGYVGLPNGMIGDPILTDHQTSLDAVAIFGGFARHRLRLGAGYKLGIENTDELKNYGPGVTFGTLTDVSNTSNVFMPDSFRIVRYLSLQDEWGVAPDWEVTAGVRYDHYSDFGGTVNPRVAVVWSTAHNLNTKFLYGRAFRAPSFSEQFAINNPSILGNPNLAPETIETREVAFDYRPTLNLQTNLSLYSYNIKELIDFVPSGSGSNTAQNAKSQDGYGFEVETDWKPSATKLHIKANYAWQHATDANTGDRVAYAPTHQAYLSANYDFSSAWSASTQINWVGDRFRESTDPRPPVPNYTLVNLTARHKRLDDGLEIALTVKNLFNKHAYEPSNGLIPGDYPLPGRSVYAEARMQF